MRNVLLGCIVVGVLGCGHSEEVGQPPSGNIDDEVASFLELYLGALETRDVALLETLYADDGRFEWIEDGQIRYRSPADVLAGLAALPSDASIVPGCGPWGMPWGCRVSEPISMPLRAA